MKIILTLVLLCFFLSPGDTSASQFENQSTFQIQRALGKLGYDVGSPDGVWGPKTSEAVRHYRYDFGMSDKSNLSIQDTNKLLERVGWFDEPPGIFIAKNPSWRVSPEVEQFRTPNFEPEFRFYASKLHFLADEMASTPIKEPWKWPIGDFMDAYEFSAIRAIGWLERDLARLNTSEPSLGAILIATDLLNLAKFRPALAADIPLKMGQAVAIANRLFDATSLTSDVEPLATYHLFNLLGETSFCESGKGLDRELSDLATTLIAKFEAIHPNSFHIGGILHAMSYCVNSEEKRQLMRERLSRADRASNPEIRLKAILDYANVEYEVGTKETAKALYIRAIDLAKRNGRLERFVSENSSRLVRSGLKDQIGNILLDTAINLGEKPEDTRAWRNSATYATANLMRIGYSFNEIDPIAREFVKASRSETLLGYYSLALTDIRDSGDLKNTKFWAQLLSDRALISGDLFKGEAFSEIFIDVALEQGEFAEAEEMLLHFISFARRGAADPRVTRWQGQLRLSNQEGLSPGFAFSRSMSQYLEAACSVSPPDWENISRLTPIFSWENVRNDPEFEAAALEYGLSDKIWECHRGDPIRSRASLDRIGCYLWARDDLDERVNVAMRQWEAENDIGTGDEWPLSLIENFHCPMGVAEAGKLNLLQKFSEGQANGTRSDGILLLKLALNSSPSFAKSVADRFRPNERGEYDDMFAAIEAKGRLKDPNRSLYRSSALQNKMLSDWPHYIDGSQLPHYRLRLLDLGIGYAALNLDELALMFIELGAPELSREISPKLAAEIVSDSEKIRFYLARARLAFKREEYAIAKSYTYPLVKSALNQLQQGRLGGEESFGQWSARLSDVFELYLSILAGSPDELRKSDPELILAAQQFLGAAHSASTTGRLAARLHSNYPDLVRNYQDLQNEIRAAISEAAKGNRDTDVSVLKHKLDIAKRQLRDIDPTLAGGSKLPSVLDLRTVQSEASDGVIVVLSSLQDHVLISTVSHDSIEFSAGPIPRKNIQSLVEAFRSQILSEEDPFSKEGEFLLNLVLRPFDKSGIAEKVSFVVDGPFVSLPFGALPLKTDEGLSFLGVETAISIIPSLSQLRLNRREQSKKDARPLLGIGDAFFSEGSAGKYLGFMPTPLQETSVELRFLAAVLGADINRDLLLRYKATEKTLLEMSEQGELAKYQIVAFATHGFFAQVGKLNEPGLLLSEPLETDTRFDGVLSASEIYDLKLDANLVLLSACDTGNISGGQNGLSSLAQAFTYAGARNLIATHWPIDSAAAIEITKRLALTLKADPTSLTSFALQKAIQGILADPNLARFHHPRYWASHFVIGSS